MLRFKSIEIYGFKSFPDKVVVPFEEGMTAIVGPNGCGKSNVADAIRWVLGERNAKLVRSKTMADVIFHGTDNRKSLSYCEVSLVFNNEEPRIFPLIEVDEVKLTRKVFKNGNSEYLINGRPCLQRDIVAMVRETGLGREGYSIVGQSRVKEIVDAKPEARRALFEDAAGVLGKKQSKKEAEKKLEVAQSNIDLFQARISQQEENLKYLEKRSIAAKKFLDIRESLKNLETNEYIYRYESNSEQREKYNVKLVNFENQLLAKNEEKELLNNKFKELTQEQTKIDGAITGLRLQQQEIAVRTESKKGKGNTLGERISNLNNTKEEYSKNQLKLENDLDNASREYREYDAKRNICIDEITQNKAILNDLENRYKEVVDKILTKQNQADQATQEILKNLEISGDLKENSGKIKALRQASFDRLNEIIESIKKLNEEKESLILAKEALDNAVNKSQRDFERLQKSKDSIKKDLDSQLGYVDFTNSIISKLENEIENAKTKIKFYEQVQNNNESYVQSVRGIKAAMKEDEEIAKRVQGIVCEVMDVPLDYQLAIETALGNNMQNIITNDEMDAKYLIEYLKSARLGQATFLPISSYKTRELSPGLRPILDEPGCLGIASKLVKYNARFFNIFSGLLGSTLICDNLDSAIRISRKYGYAVKIVTLDGNIINTSGSLTGGSKKGTELGMFSSKSTIEALKKSIVDKQKELESAKERLNNYSADLKDLKEQFEEYEQELHTAEIKYTQDEARVEKVESQIEEKQESINNLNSSKETLEKAIASYDMALNKLEQDSQKDKNSIDEEAQKNKEEIKQLIEERERLSKEIQSIKDKIADCEKEKAVCEASLERLEKDKKNLLASIENCKSILRLNDEKLKTANNLLKDVKVSVDDQKAYEEISSTIETLEKRKGEILIEITSINEKLEKLNSEITACVEGKTKALASLEKLEEDMNAMATHILEEYELTYETCLPLKDPNYIHSQGVQSINSLKKAKNALGPVDLTSIEEFERQSAEYHTLVEQRDDVLKTKEDLLTIISELTNEILKIFNAEFEKINENFKFIFRELFGGGRAELKILDPEEGQDPLDAGVEIFIEPPGKKFKSMLAFSGGEKSLTAIAILFAILRMRPMPFCVFDEVDADLDDGNIGVYAKYLQKFANDTQFVLITHRKPTMELSNRLYGVTMEEAGISKVVSVALSDALKLKEEK